MTDSNDYRLFPDSPEAREYFLTIFSDERSAVVASNTVVVLADLFSLIIEGLVALNEQLREQMTDSFYNDAKHDLDIYIDKMNANISSVKTVVNDFSMLVSTLTVTRTDFDNAVFDLFSGITNCISAGDEQLKIADAFLGDYAFEVMNGMIIHPYRFMRETFQNFRQRAQEIAKTYSEISD